MRKRLVLAVLVALGAMMPLAAQQTFAPNVPAWVVPAQYITGGGVASGPICFDPTNQDVYIARVTTNDLGIYTSATACASGTLRLDVSASAVTIAGTNPLVFGTNGSIRAVNGDGLFNFLNNAGTAGFELSGQSDGIAYFKSRGDADTAILKSNQLQTTGKYTSYNGLATAGWGVPAIQGVGAPGSTVNVGVASIATYTVGAADGDVEVSATCLVTVATTHSFSLDVIYTDTSNVSRTMILPVAALAGSFITGGLITNITGAGNYESAVMHISAKAGTAVTIRTSAGGTFTTVTYFPRAIIKQVA